jgi:predicted transcriptional regulator of viral defense system
MKYNELLKFAVDSKVQIFSIEDLMKLFPNEKEESMARLVYNWIDSDKVIRLKRGLYQISYPEKKIIPDMYVANRLYSPSYVSLETILSMHGIIPEIAMSVTSVTTKATRHFKNSYGGFSYRTVKNEYFTGYYLLKERDFEILAAEPEKAVIDFLYLNNLSKIDRADGDRVKKLSKKLLKKYADLMAVNIGGLYADL